MDSPFGWLSAVTFLVVLRITTRGLVSGEAYIYLFIIYSLKTNKMRRKTIFPLAALLLAIFIYGCEKDDPANDDSLSPIITSTTPLGNESGVARNISLSAVFSMEMNASTINTTSFTLKQGTTIIPGEVEYSGVTATFTSLGTLAAATNYTATITTDAKSADGKAIATSHVWNFSTAGTTSHIDEVNLGTSGSYVILAKTAINNNPTSAITGDLGLSPAATSYIAGFSLTDATGYATSAQVTGSVYAADMAEPTATNLTTAVENMITAYNDAAGRTSPDFLELATGDIGGTILTPGLYKWTNTVTVPTSITLSGNATDVWIFQIAGDLTTSSAINVVLSGGAQSKNIFWQVAGQVTLGSTSHFEGIILSMTGITLQTGASVNGRLLAQTAVVLDGNVVVQPN